MAAYVSFLARSGYSVTVFSSLNGTDGESVHLDSRVRLIQEPGSRWGGFRRTPALWRQAQGAEMDLIHSHGLWTDVNRLAGDLARRRGVPHLLAPCGMLAPGALRHHGWKKIPARVWFQGRALREAQCLHAKSEQEYEGIRQFGLRNPVAIIPNPITPPPAAKAEMLKTETLKGEIGRAEGVGQRSEVGNGNADIKARPSLSSISPLPSPLSRGQGSEVSRQEPDFSISAFSVSGFRASSVVPRRRTVLFLGRLHPVKGVARLVEAWMEIQRANAETLKAEKLKSDLGPLTSDLWSLVIAGPDEAGMRPGLEAALRAAGCGDSVIFTGQLDEQQKWAAYKAADLFVMPSDFENFGNAIVEAMLSGLPVVTTTGTPWKELAAEGAGWCVEPTVEAVRDALGAAMALADGARQEMGRRAAALAAKFSPEQVGADLIQVYEWLLGRGPRPGCII